MSLFPCPTCKDGRVFIVTDSRPVSQPLGIRRRRECAQCKTRITTYEFEHYTPFTDYFFPPSLIRQCRQVRTALTSLLSQADNMGLPEE